MCKPWKIGSNTGQLTARQADEKRRALREIREVHMTER